MPGATTHKRTVTVTSSHDAPLVVNCPDCRRVMWAGSSACGYCRNETQPPVRPPKAADEVVESATVYKDKKRKNT